LTNRKTNTHDCLSGNISRRLRRSIENTNRKGKFKFLPSVPTRDVLVARPMVAL
jgi:hypothetical protein